MYLRWSVSTSVKSSLHLFIPVLLGAHSAPYMNIVKTMILRTLQKMVERINRKLFTGYSPLFSPKMMENLSQQDQEILAKVKPFTMTGSERVVALSRSVQYLVKEEIPGSFLECGVWKGGSMLAAALTLVDLHFLERELYLFDTFSGMTTPSELDVDYQGNRASEQYEQEDEWCSAGLSEVKGIMQTGNYPEKLIHYIIGDVMETLPDKAPAKIALLRLDTDWYKLTKHELNTLFPRLSPGGVLIIDDYGHWQGAKKAVNEYFAENNIKIKLHPIDFSAVIAIKSNK